MKFIRVSVVLSLFTLILSMVSAQDAQTPQEICDAATPNELTEMQFDEPEQVLEQGVDYRAVFCTGAGAIYIDLYETLTPVTVNNFVFLAQQGYYDNTTFHRVLESFMAQGGDPSATGAGGPGYQFEDEPIGFLVFDRPGLLAMANAGPGTNGSQFFITTVPTPHLNYRHTIFGDVLEGQENVENIQLRDPQTATEPGETLSTVVIITDPSTVDSTDEPLAPATQEDVAAAFEAFTGQLPPEFPLDTEVSGLYTTEETIATVPEANQEAFAEFAETYGHQYRYTARIVNASCDPQQFFSRLQYTIDTFESAEAASNALADGFPEALATSNGFELAPGFTDLYTLSVETCSGDAGIYAMSLYTRGRYLVTVEALIDEGFAQQVGVGLDVVLDQGIASPFEGELAPVYLPEIRSQ